MFSNRFSGQRHSTQRELLSLLLSTIAHLVLLVLLSWWIVRDDRAVRVGIPIAWVERPAIEWDDPIPVPLVVAAEDSAVSGGTVAAKLVAEPEPVPVQPLMIDAHAELLDARRPPSGELGEQIRIASTLGANRGDGDGAGHGDGSGSGFFGAARTAQSVVFVVDCSSSMNRPHDSAAKTRFRRLKIEMLKTIAAMDATSQFFIVFFNDHAVPMPAQSLQYATEANKQRYLDWMARTPALGETDPRAAMRIALRLNPQVIYFLTDGRFTYKIEQELLSIRQSRTTIQTFVFGDSDELDDAAALMQAIAENNHGEYHFVP